MKKIILLLPFLLLFSCSVQKRKYQKGFYVNWHKNTAQKEKKEAVATVHYKKIVPEPVITSQLPQPVIHKTAESAVVASGNNDMDNTSILKRRPLSLQLNPDSCDEIIFRSGDETKVKIMEISATELKYKRCDNISGPLYVSKKSEVFMVKYANGTNETFKAEVPGYNNNSNSNDDMNTYSKAKNKARRVQHPLAILSMILGITSLASGYIALILAASGATGAYVLLIPLLVGLAAAFSGRTALNDMRAQPETYKGKGKAIAGLIEGLIVASLCVLILLLVIAL